MQMWNTSLWHWQHMFCFLIILKLCVPAEIIVRKNILQARNTFRCQVRTNAQRQIWQSKKPAARWCPRQLDTMNGSPASQLQSPVSESHFSYCSAAPLKTEGPACGSKVETLRSRPTEAVGYSATIPMTVLGCVARKGWSLRKSPFRCWWVTIAVGMKRLIVESRVKEKEVEPQWAYWEGGREKGRGGQWNHMTQESSSEQHGARSNVCKT